MTSPADDVRLSRWHALGVHAIASVLFFSGGLAALKDILDAFGHEGTLSATVKTWALCVHGGAAMAFLVALGSVLPTHVVRAWKSGRNRFIGIILLALIALLVVSGYGLYYFSREELRLVTQWTHLGLGLAEPIVFIVHVLRGRRTRTKSGP